MQSARSDVVQLPASSSLSEWVCATCKLVEDGEGNPLHPRPHHQSFKALRDARKRKCAICTRIWGRLFGEWESNISRDCVEVKIAYHFTTRTFSGGEEYYKLVFICALRRDTDMSDTDSVLVSFDLFRDNTQADGKTCEPSLIRDFSARSCGKSPESFDNEITASTNSVPTTRLVQYWLSDCQANHPSCTRSADAQSRLPLRVIDVGKIGDGSVRLFASDWSAQYGRYITLSHCWGDADFLKLTAENESSLRAGFAVEDLPKTFREAIQVTRALSVQYLWIDSLCIMQDSLKDWRRQSALMGDIYRNCVCNIAATSSSNSHGGLFVERDPNLVSPPTLTIRRRRRDHGATDLERYHVWESRLWRNHVQSSPLNRRAWVLQERLLAPRVVHFSKYIFWECNSLVACDVLPYQQFLGFPIDREGFYTKFLPLIEKISDKQDEVENTKQLQEARGVWRDVVHTYSQCLLTKGEDILVAISGIANMMEVLLKDECIAGLWKSTLLEDLLWTSITAVRLFPNRAPTWSWASMEGAIMPGDLIYGSAHHLEEMVEIKDIQLKTTGDARNGQVETGYLKFEGLLFELSCKEDKYVQNISSWNFEVEVDFDDKNAFGSPRNEKQYTKVLGMPIFIGSAAKRISLHGLVLELAPGGYPEGHFVRIGTFFFVLELKEGRPSVEDIQLELKDQERKIIVLA